MRAEGTVARPIIAFACVAVFAIAWVGACQDSAGPTPPIPPSPPPPPPPSGLIVSNPIAVGVVASGTGAGAFASAAAAAAVDSIAYVSLTPGSVVGGARATIRRIGSAGSFEIAVFDGGFDPVSVIGRSGDSIEVAIKEVGGATIRTIGLRVAAMRAPVVVRTQPPPRKRDHPLNAAIVVVFDEPIAGSSESPGSVRLLRGQTEVSGSARFLDPSLDANHVSMAFVPDAPLAAGVTYKLVVTTQIRDLTGDALAMPDTVEFTTGASVIGPPASIQTSPDSSLLLYGVGATDQVTVTVRDAAGNQLVDQPVTWSSSDSSGLAVSPSGRLTALALGFYTVTASVGGGGPTDFLFVGVIAPPLPPASVKAYPDSATLLPQTRILLGAFFQDAQGNYLGGNSFTWRSTSVGVATVDSAGWVTAVSPGTAGIIATGAGLSDTATVTVTETVRFQSVSAGPVLTCAVSTAGAAYCWPYFTAGQTGSVGYTVPQTGPGLITAGLVFATVDAGGTGDLNDHACGVTNGAEVYCWGQNGYGQLGNGATNSIAWTPTLVGGLSFSSVSAGGLHTCGVTTGGAAYCWGDNSSRQLGGYSTGFGVPVAVLGGLTFVSVSAGAHHTCGVTNSGAAYCWGDDSAGQLGDGDSTSHLSPVAVQGGLTFASVSAGFDHTCGLTTGGVAYCWGRNDGGALGDGTTTPAFVRTPVAVSGRLTFKSLSAGFGLTCGVTNPGTAYCWGEGWLTPTVVPGNLTFAMISAGGQLCGVTASNLAYCWRMTDMPVKVLGQP